jgi:hypothetical protein
VRFQPPSSDSPALSTTLTFPEIDRMKRSLGKEQDMRRDPTIKKRQRLARHVERAAVPERPFNGPGPRYLVQPSVTAACAPSLHAIAAALRDETQPIDDAKLGAVESWLRNGAGPFFGRDSMAALKEVVGLEQIVVGGALAPFDEEPVVGVAV